MVKIETWWCEICIEDPKIDVTDYHKSEDLRNHYLNDHTKEELADCIDNMGTNPHMWDREEADKENAKERESLK